MGVRGKCSCCIVFAAPVLANQSHGSAGFLSSGHRTVSEDYVSRRADACAACFGCQLLIPWHPRSTGLPATSNVVVHTGKVLSSTSLKTFFSQLYLHFKAVSRAIHSRRCVNTLKSEYSLTTTRFYLRRTSLMMSTISSCNGGVLSRTPCFAPRVSILKVQGNDSGIGRRFLRALQYRL